MRTFLVYTKGGSRMILFGYNLIDACLRPNGINYKEVVGYREGGKDKPIIDEDKIVFAK